MTRDETVALFLQCEVKRAGARAAGKSDDEAHKAAKAHWNEWAQGMLKKRKALEEAGDWAAKPGIFGFDPKNDKTREWIDSARIDFSRYRICSGGPQIGTLRAMDEEEDTEILTKTARLDFSGFLFPGDADFKSAIFCRSEAYPFDITASGDASFSDATFCGAGSFEGATFTGNAYFERAAFTHHADFRRAAFTRDADFQSVTFAHEANFPTATFTGIAQFRSAIFHGYADFPARRLLQRR